MTDLYDYHNGPNLGLEPTTPPHEPPAAPQAEPSDDEWLRRLGELLGEYAEAVSFDSEDDIERAANAIHSHARALLARYGAQPAASVEPVAQIYRKGFQHGSIVWTAAGLAADLPDGTSLYAAPVAAQASGQAQDGRPTDDALWDQTLRERDEYHDMADQLAAQIAAITGEEIGEHSSANCPWRNAMLAADDYIADKLRSLCDGHAAQAPAANADALDAARYRWLRVRWGRIADTYDGDSDRLVEIREADDRFEGWDVSPESLDAAIDAAMQRTSGGGHG